MVHRPTRSREARADSTVGRACQPANRPTSTVRMALPMTVTVLLLLTGCGGQDPAAPDRTGDGRPTSATTKALWAQMRRVVERPAVPLRAPSDLKPIGEFTRADVDALADRAIDILKRSADPKLSRLNPSQAVNRVYANQYGSTTFEFKQDAIDTNRGYDWQWLAASRYPKEAGLPTATKVLKVTGAVSTDTDRTATGERAPFLTVTVQAHIAQTVTTKQYGRVPIIVRRTVRASGFRPQGGPEWWPSVMARTTPFGNTGCGLYRGAILDPLDDPDDLRRDLASLEDSLNTPGVVSDPIDTRPDSDELRDFIETDCAKR